MKQETDIPGVKMYQSLLSEQRFLGIQILNTAESVANVIQFIFPNLNEDYIQTIRNAKEDTNDSIEIPINRVNTRVAYGSIVLKNMYGTIVVVPESLLQTLFQEVEMQPKEWFIHSFLCIITMQCVKMSETHELIVHNIDMDCIWQTYHDFPNRIELIEHIRKTQTSEQETLLTTLGYRVSYMVQSIHELTYTQRLAYLKQETNETK